MMARKRKRRIKFKYPNILISGLVLLIVLTAGIYLGAALFSAGGSEEPVLSEQLDGRGIKLYYYNRLKDKDKTFSDRYVLPITRKVLATKTPVQDAIGLLLKGELTWQERSAGFETEFPNPDFKLKSAKLKNGVLTLEFPEVPGFTSGGSARIGLIMTSIIKTAKQFPEVREVKFEPEYLFQP
ncbi:MAG: GerMN domain-containing protein [Candidatus Saganbacteria bacterium]|nr:GerMN domain-containing protein [Candidatus Saganbacteria bacterium]